MTFNVFLPQKNEQMTFPFEYHYKVDTVRLLSLKYTIYEMLLIEIKSSSKKLTNPSSN